MCDAMAFPNDIQDFLYNYSFVDEYQYYTNGIRLIPLFRVQQALDHYYDENPEENVNNV